MKYSISLSLLLLLSFSVSALAFDLSATRRPGENYEAARNRSFFRISLQDPPPSVNTPSPTQSAEAVKRPLEELNIQEIPDVISYSELQKHFFYIRDTRFLSTEKPDFPRRLTWLYPDDGCFARAEVAKLELVSQRFLPPRKIFVFGDLISRSPNSPKGHVQWWYHVAVTYRVGSNVYVFDPAIEPKRPLLVSEWNTRVGGDFSRVQYSVCDPGTYDPSFDCFAPTPLTPEQAYEKQKYFLNHEWTRILELHRDPEKELGSFPPWISNDPRVGAPLLSTEDSHSAQSFYFAK